jgi:ubiquinone/menaquinone biosynthesis C-methylase UbiE
MNVAIQTPDFAAIKQRQQTVWSSGDYSRIGVTLQIVGEMLCERLDLHAGSKVLDVAAGNGNATLAAARRYAEVTSTDYVEALLRDGEQRAQAEGLPVAFTVADVEALPFADHSFDVVLSTFGVMFAPDQEKSAGEMLRVVRPGGRVGMANWTPDSFIGQVLRIVTGYVPPPAGVRPTVEWGTDARLAELFAGQQVESVQRFFTFRYRSAKHWLEIFRTYYGPTHRAFAALDAGKAAALEADLLDLLGRLNTGGAHTLTIPSAYLESVVTKA